MSTLTVQDGPHENTTRLGHAPPHHGNASALCARLRPFTRTFIRRHKSDTLVFHPYVPVFAHLMCDRVWLHKILSTERDRSQRTVLGSSTRCFSCDHLAQESPPGGHASLVLSFGRSSRSSPFEFPIDKLKTSSCRSHPSVVCSCYNNLWKWRRCTGAERDSSSAV